MLIARPVASTTGVANRTNGLWRVRVFSGRALVREYVWASEQHARAFVASLDPALTIEVVDPNAPVPVSSAPRSAGHSPEPTDAPADRYRIHVAISARTQLGSVAAADWTAILRRLLELARTAGSVATASREALQSAGIEPPYLRVRAGKYVIICDADPRRRAVTVLHVLPVGPGESSASAA